jgi:hypothetical protein
MAIGKPAKDSSSPSSTGASDRVTCTFGIWLIGFFLLLRVGAKDETFTPDAVGWYTLILIIPVAIFAVPEFVTLDFPFMIAFAAIIVLLLLLGVAFHDLNHDVVSHDLYRILGLFGMAPPAYQAR